MGTTIRNNFQVIKDKISTTLLLVSPDFNEVFEVDIDASMVGV